MQVIRADHIGSLLRPDYLLAARREHAGGSLSAESLREVEDRAIIDAIYMQREVGLNVVSDGEFRRSSFLAGPYECLEGLVAADHGYTPIWHGETEAVANSGIPIDSLVASQKLNLRKRMTGAETAFLKDNAGSAYKVTMPGPTMYLTLFRPGITDMVYAGPQELLDDLVAIYQGEVDAQLDDGASYIQLDSLRYAQALSGALPPNSDVHAVVGQALAADNAIFSRARGKATRAMHICRGNHRSAWLMTGGYDAVAEQLFSEADVDRFLLEYDDERSGGFEPLRFIPEGKVAVLGLVCTKTPQLESQEQLLRRIEEAANYLPIEQLALSPQCGFASTELGNLVSQDDQRRKLELVVDTAAKVWG